VFILLDDVPDLAGIVKKLEELGQVDERAAKMRGW
jgi:hypothetical protein